MTVDYAELARTFETCRIDAGSFSHADHVGVAYEMLRRYDFLDATVRYSKSIRTIAARAGEARKFNTTITLAFLSLIAERMETTAHGSYQEFLEQNPDLCDVDLLQQWYSTERMRSELARNVFLMPDATAG